MNEVIVKKHVPYPAGISPTFCASIEKSEETSVPKLTLVSPNGQISFVRCHHMP